MKGTEHYREAERLLEDASFVDASGNPVRRGGQPMQPGELAALVAAAQVHATLAQAAVTAMEHITYYVGDSDEVTAWARITGLLPPRDDTTSRACEFEHHTTCAGCRCECHKPLHTCVPFDEPKQRLADCGRCRDEASKEAPEQPF